MAIFGGIGLAFAATLILLGIDRTLLWFPILSAIAFPAMAISPFLIMRAQIPLSVKLVIILVLGLVIVPFLGLRDTFYLELAIQIAIFAALALGLNIVVGFAGLLDLGYVAFFAVGAYTWGIFASRQAETVFKTSNALAAPGAFWLFLFAGVIIAGLTGILLGLPVLRLRGDYLAIVTLGFGEMVRVLITNLNNVSGNPDTSLNITNGTQGLPGIASPPLPPFVFDRVGGLARSIGLTVSNPEPLTYQLFFYFLALVAGGVLVLIAARLDNSPIGRAWTAIREDETAAIAMGVPLVRMKLLAFAMGAAFAGAMGVIYAAHQNFVGPENFSFSQSIAILAVVIVGGMGSIRGVILGSIVITLMNLQFLPNLSILINSFKSAEEVSPAIRAIFRAWPPQLEVANYQRFFFGILLILMMIFRPAGLLPASRRKLEIQERMKKDEPEEPEELTTPPTEIQVGEVGNVT
jgi:branched-chain amino acid transport system permease protein